MKTLYLNNDKRDFVKFRKGSGRNSIEIYDIEIGSERGIGRGRELITNLCNLCKDDYDLVYAITRESNHVAQQFYTALGFVVSGVLEDFYINIEPLTTGIDTRCNETAFLYMLELK